jgi:hypothetical protein
VVRIDKHTDKLTSDNRKKLDEYSKQFGSAQAYLPLLQAIADILDTAASGGDAYVTIGANRERSSLLMTLHDSGRKAYVSQTTLVDLAEALIPLL